MELNVSNILDTEVSTRMHDRVHVRQATTTRPGHASYT